MKSSLVFLLLLSIVLGFHDKDGSEKVIQPWLDTFHKSILTRDRDAFKQLFADAGVPMFFCKKVSEEKRKYRDEFLQGDDLWNFLLNNATDIHISLHESQYDRHNSDLIRTQLAITGMGETGGHMAEIDFEFNSTHVLWRMSEYFPCGMVAFNRDC
ncbi:hypothetical protein CRE_06817 [Caenorhabditis remanei]|uniref:Uncharacterized protein n=1 Tax=Caenorhabditis remanei TaxID=31234 RepID=E3MNZ6_CAERE|nr:hypothetical protein CRE_06817 [Caenorhabditis remanei]